MKVYKHHNKECRDREKAKEVLETNDEPLKETESENILSGHTSLYGLQNIKTSLGGYNKAGVKKYLQGILDEQARQEEARNRLVENLQNQIAGLKRDKDESIRKYNELLAEKNQIEAQQGPNDETEALQEKIVELVGKIDSMQVEKEAGETENEKLKTEIKILKEKNAGLCNNRPAENASADLKQAYELQIGALKAKLEKAEISNKNMSDALNAGEKARISLQGENSSLAASLERVKQEIQQKDKDRKEAIAAKNEAAVALKKQDYALKEKNRLIDDMSVREKGLQQEIVEIREKFDTVKQEKEASASRVRVLLLKIDVLARKKTELTQALVQSKTALQDAEEYAARLEAELESVYATLLGKQSAKGPD